MFRSLCLAVSALCVVAACSPSDRNSSDASKDASKPNAGVVNVYAARHYDSDAALYEKFTDETGIRVNILEGNSDQLIQRLENEAEFSPADVLITVDAGRLWRGVERGVFQTLDDEALLNRVPASMRDADGFWIGLTRRARVIVYNKDDGAPEGLSTYADLAKPEFRGRICMRSSTNTYNQSLLASIISRQGEEQALAWTKAVVDNFARPPQGNDTSLLRAVAAGECGLTLANTYYIARLAGSDAPADKAVFDRLGVIFPDQEGNGAHVNISGAGIAKHAPNRQNGLTLIRFLTRDDVQSAFSAGNNEYPAVTGVEPADHVAALGSFQADDMNVSELGRYQAAAVMVFDRAGWR